MQKPSQTLICEGFEDLKSERVGLVVVVHAPAIAAEVIVAACPAPFAFPVPAWVAVVALPCAIITVAYTGNANREVPVAAGLRRCCGAGQRGDRDGGCCCNAGDGFLEHGFFPLMPRRTGVVRARVVMISGLCNGG